MLSASATVALKLMRKSLITYILLAPLANSVGLVAAVSDSGSISPWINPLAITSVIFDSDNGVSVGNLFTAARSFDSVPSAILATLGLTDWTGKDIGRFFPRPKFLLNQSFII